MVVSTAGGVNWAKEKALYAIVNGISGPATTSSSGLSGAATAALVTSLLFVGGAVFGVAFVKVPAFKQAVTGAAKSAKGLFGKSYSSVPSVGTTNSASLMHTSASAPTGFQSGSYGGL